MNVLFLIAAAAAAQSPQQFDLTCNGVVHSLSVTLAPQQPDTAYSYHYRIDLRSGRWCDGACEATRPIAEVQPNFLRLDEQKDVDGPERSEKLTSSIDRTTGAHHITSESRSRLTGRLLIMWDGKCEPWPFSGFPELPRKF